MTMLEIRFMNKKPENPLLAPPGEPCPQMVRLVSCKSHTLLNLRNRLARVQALRTRPATIHNRMASVEAHAVI